MKITVRQLKTLIREAAAEAMEEGNASDSPYGMEHGESTGPSTRDRDYEDMQQRRYNSRDRDSESSLRDNQPGSQPSNANEALQEAFRAGYRRGLKARFR